MKSKIVLVLSIILMSSLAQAMCLSIDEGRTRGCARDLSKNCAKGTYSFHDNSCLSSKSGKEFIDEILNLPAGGRIHPDLYKIYEVNEVAQSLVYRYFLKNEMPQIRDQDVENPAFDFFGDTQIQIAFKDANAESIAKSGFLNQHQTGTTGGCACLDNRAQAENNMVGLYLESNYQKVQNSDPNATRPKYGYFVPSAPLPPRTSGYVDIYGNVIAVMDNSLKKRMTFTDGDSLNRSADPNRKLHTTGFLSNQIDLRLPQDGFYYEAQIWGEVKAKDINYFLVNCPGLNATSQAGIEKVANAFPDKSIYSCEAKTATGLNIFVPKRKLKISRLMIASASVNGVDISVDLKKQCDKKGLCSFSAVTFYPKSITKPSDSDQFEIRYFCADKDGENEHVVKVDAYANRATFSLNCQDEKAAAYSIPQKIKIKSATYGGNITGIKDGNVTDKAAKFCDDKDSCSYKVAAKFLGDPAQGKAKSFKLTYDCVPKRSKADSKTFTLAADTAENTVLQLTCPIEAP